MRGLVRGETVAVPGWPVGETRAFAIVGWSASLGTNFNPTWLCLCEGCLSGFGVSPIGSGSPSGIIQGGGPPLLPLNPFQTINSGLVLNGPLSPELCPTIVTQPSNQTALSRSTATFTVVAQSRPQPLTYQWQFNGTNLPGATTSALVLTNVQISQAGAYSVTVANGLSAISSSLAILVVGVPPSITTSPQSQTVSAGSTVDFVVIATGSPPLAYNWFFNGTNSLTGSTGSALQLGNVQSADAGNYTVVENTVYGAVTSSPALLTVFPSAPTIVRSPPSHTAIVGWSLDLTVSAHGSLPLSYQWFFKGNAIPGASDDDLHLDNLQFSQSGTYTVTVSNA
ncbi:MAG: immunoglobulin domain-containing protein, partial [Verrucomicrobia bacterium]|nr:immunoglobulin domain-containing protein [Verrucomicrobiota bacterium]